MLNLPAQDLFQRPAEKAGLDTRSDLAKAHQGSDLRSDEETRVRLGLSSKALFPQILHNTTVHDTALTEPRRVVPPHVAALSALGVASVPLSRECGSIFARFKRGQCSPASAERSGRLANPDRLLATLVEPSQCRLRHRAAQAAIGR